MERKREGITDWCYLGATATPEVALGACSPNLGQYQLDSGS